MEHPDKRNELDPFINQYGQVSGVTRLIDQSKLQNNELSLRKYSKIMLCIVYIGKSI